MLLLDRNYHLFIIGFQRQVSYVDSLQSVVGGKEKSIIVKKQERLTCSSGTLAWTEHLMKRKKFTSMIIL